MHPKSTSYEHGTVLENRQVARGTYLLRTTAEGIAPQVRPGQFVMLRLPHRSDPLLGRPLAVYRVDSNSLDVVYLVVGKMTARLAELKPGGPLELWGPLGSGFEAKESANSLESKEIERLIMVAGGIGQTPFLMLADSFLRTGNDDSRSAVLLYGTRSEDRICCVEDFQRIGAKVEIATDDGSRGFHGPITELIPKFVSEPQKTRIVCCGPHPMLKSAFEKCRERNLSCEVSLESPMSCGLGICFGCAVEIRSTNTKEPQTREYARCCTEGPVFDAYQLVWD